MGIITNMYKKNFLQRYDKDGAIPYCSPSDYPGIICRESSFQNSIDVTVQYFIYNYEEYRQDRIILFCPGMGPGHTAYLSEIETLCRAGYQVLTLDYTGCGASGGERMTSVNRPTEDVMELLALLDIKKEIIPVGHSLGGYTALNIANISNDIKRAVIISGFVSIADEMTGFVKLRALAKAIQRYEKKNSPKYGSLNNLEYISGTNDRLLWLHSTDDPIVNYKNNAARVIKACNPNVRVITVENKKHNPQYSAEALETMNRWMGEYYSLIRDKKLTTLEERKAYFDDKPAKSMTGQDPSVINEILSFIDN